MLELPRPAKFSQKPEDDLWSEKLIFLIKKKIRWRKIFLFWVQVVTCSPKKWPQSWRSGGWRHISHRPWLHSQMVQLSLPQCCLYLGLYREETFDLLFIHLKCNIVNKKKTVIVTFDTWINFHVSLYLILDFAVQLPFRHNDGNRERGIFFRFCQRRCLKECSCWIHAG